MKHPRRISKISRIRKLGFRARQATVGGRRVLKNRRNKGRRELSVSESFVQKNKLFSRRR